MNSREEIQKTIQDHQRTEFGGWPWGRQDMVHVPVIERFAKHRGLIPKVNTLPLLTLPSRFPVIEFMKKYFVLLYAVVVTTLSGCAVGPLVSHETARTVGDNNSELIGGYGQAGYVFKWNYGLAENLDLGLHWESLSIGIRAKYAFINSDDGWSLATALGTGVSIGGSHYYGDIIGSYLVNSWEPYGTARFVHVNNDPLEFKDADTGQVDFTVPGSQYQYGQLILGTRYWFTPNWLLSLEASSLFALTSGLNIGSHVLVGGAFGYRF